MHRTQYAKGRANMNRRTEFPEATPKPAGMHAIGRRFAFGGVLCVALVMSAFASSQAQSGNNAPVTVSLRTAFGFNGTTAPFYYAEKLGYYKNDGLNVQIEAGTGSQISIDAVAAGGDTFTFANSASAMLSVGKGLGVVAVATTLGTGSYGIFVPKSSDITSISQLAGKTIISSPGTPQAELLGPFLTKNGVNPNSVKVVNVAGSALLTTYASGVGDALVQPIPYGQPIIDPKRPSRTFLFSDHGFSLPDYSILVSVRYLNEHPNVVRAFVEATMKGFAAAAKQPGAAVDAMVSAQPSVDRATALAQLTGWIPLFCPPNFNGEPYGKQSAAQWDFSATLLKQYADLSPENKEPYYTNQFFDGPKGINVASCPIVSGG
jgi:NitT/TauT family transport system substrate-binding protein